MKTIILAAFISLTTMGCGYHIPIAGEGYDGPTNPQPGQLIAVHIIWNETFGFADGTEPPILWHFNDNCIDSRGIDFASGPKYGTPGGFKDIHSGMCLYGQFETSGWVDTTEFDATNRVDVEWHGNFSDNATLAHELCHAYNFYMGGDGDGNHVSDCFSMPSLPYDGFHEAVGSRAYNANQALIAAGL